MQKLSVLALSVIGIVSSAQALDFNATYDPSATPQQIASMQAAMGDWSSKLSSTAHINVSFVADPSLGNSGNSYLNVTASSVSFSTYKAALTTYATSALDATATSYLQATTTNSYNFLINGTNQDNGDKHLYSSSQIQIVPALAKALGGLGIGANAGQPDFTVYYNPDSSRYDFDRSNGISPTKFDFEATILTQLGQGLGFDTHLDDLDYYAGAGINDSDADGDHYAEDLFRYEQFGGTANRSWTAGPETKYFSVDGGLTSLGDFHTGAYNGDGYTTGSFIEANGVFLRPLISGQQYDISALDLQAMDAMGWNVRAVPEPAPFAALGLGALAVLRRSRRR